MSAQIGGNAMEWHFRLGYAVFILLLFRLIWGVVGGHWSRFSSFLYSPSRILKYIKGYQVPEHNIGHNPLGALSVLALLGFLLFQVASGLISDDEIGSSGPLAQFASVTLVNLATFYHKDIGKLILISLVILHIGAIFFYMIMKRENLVQPMIKGNKQSAINAKNSRDDFRARSLAFAVLLGCTAFVLWMLKLTGAA